MPLRFSISKPEPSWTETENKLFARITRAVSRTVDDVTEEILTRGRSDIAGAGRFGSRWTSGLQAEKQVEQFRATITIFHTVPYFNIFEFGGTIRGKPLLWIPLSFAADAQGKKASEFGSPLFRVDRKNGGAPLLLSVADRQPKYFGKEFVVMPRKFHIRDIIRQVANKVRAIYNANFRSA